MIKKTIKSFFSILALTIVIFLVFSTYAQFGVTELAWEYGEITDDAPYCSGTIVTSCAEAFEAGIFDAQGLFEKRAEILVTATPGSTTGTYTLPLTSLAPLRIGTNNLVVRVRGKDDTGAISYSINQVRVYLRSIPPVRNLRVQ